MTAIVADAGAQPDATLENAAACVIIHRMKRWFLISAVCLVLAPGALLASANEQIAVIINRDANHTEVQLSLAAHEIEPIFGVNPGIVFSENGTVPLEQFREFGNFDLANDLLVNMTLTADAEPVERDAMSMMVHSNDSKQPFRTPWEALIATSVCDYDETAAPLTVASSHLYIGAFSYGLGADQSFRISFPETGRSEREFYVREFHEGEFVSQATYVVSDGAGLDIGPSAPPMHSRLLYFISIGIAMILAIAIVPFILRTWFIKDEHPSSTYG